MLKVGFGHWTAVVTVLSLFALLGSFVEVTVAVFVIMLPHTAEVGTVKAIVKDWLCPAPSAIGQITLPPTSEHPAVVWLALNTRPEGTASMTAAFCEALGPAL